MKPRTVTQARILTAYRKGYRVTEEGRLINPQGRELKVRLYGSQRYAVFSFTDKSHRGGRSLPVHQLAALCFFGKKTWRVECVRHLDDNPLNNSRANLALGTHVDNESDKIRISRRVLSPTQVEQLKVLQREGYSISSLSRYTGFSWWTISRAIKGQRGY